MNKTLHFTVIKRFITVVYNGVIVFARELLMFVCLGGESCSEIFYQASEVRSTYTWTGT